MVPYATDPGVSLVRAKRQQQEKDLRISAALGINPTAETTLGRDEHDREKNRGREL
jgi:hypothetical protein